MDILVCVKRVPMVGGKVVVTADGQDVDTRMSGFTVSPHEECAVEEAVQITERAGGIGHGPHARAAGGRRPAARHARARRAPRRAAGDRRPGMGPGRHGGRDRGGGRRTRRPPRSRSYCSETRPPIPAVTRWASGSRMRSGGRASPGSSGWSSPVTCCAPGGIPRRAGEVRGRAARGGQREGRASTCRGTRRCRAGCGPSGPRSPCCGRSGRPTGCARPGSGCRRRSAQRAQVLGHGAGRGAGAGARARRARRAAGGRAAGRRAGRRHERTGRTAVLCLVERDGAAIAAASLRALAFARSLADGGAALTGGRVRAGGSWPAAGSCAGRGLR